MLMRRFGATPLRIVGLPWPSLATSWSRTWRAAARLSKAAGSAFGSASTSIATLSSTSRTTPRARSRAARLLPVLVECGLQAGAGHQGRARSTGHFRQPPPLLTRDQPHRLAQGMSQQIDGVLYPARSPQRAGVQRRPQLPRTEPSGPLGQLDAALYQPAVQVVLDQPPPEADQRALAERRIPHVEAVQDQLPATVHQRALDGLVIRAAGVRLQDRGQGQLRRRHRRLALRGFRVGGCQLGLELLLEELVPVLAQPHEQLGSTDLLDDRPLGLGQLDGGTPGGGTHVWESASSKCSAHHSTQRPCPADYLTDVLGQERQDHAVVVLQRLARHQRALTIQPGVVVSRPDGWLPARRHWVRHNRRTTPCHSPHRRHLVRLRARRQDCKPLDSGGYSGVPHALHLASHRLPSGFSKYETGSRRGGWSGGPDSNRRSPAPKAGALPG